jgi:hypothetical protein
MHKHPQHSFYSLVDIRFADPVSALALSENLLILGTMMGRIAMYHLPDKTTTLLAELSSENITGITFESQDTFNIAVGDEEVLKYKLSQGSPPDLYRLKNYDNESNHKNRCDSCFTLLSNQFALLIYLQHSGENELNIGMQPTSVRMKNILTNTMDDFMIDMTNYSVPFDFDGGRFAWVEFLSEKERNICVYYFETNQKWFYTMNKEFGHISHCKLLPNNKLLIVRKLNEVEIRECEKDFKCMVKFKHIGDEVISLDYYINSSKILVNELELDNVQVVNNKNDQYIKIPADKNSMPREKEMVNLEENLNNNQNQIGLNENLSVIALDIDGNVNVWENLSNTKRFNLYDMKDIQEEYKAKQFFSMGYPYYIKANLNFYAISSDHGVFIIKKNNE